MQFSLNRAALLLATISALIFTSITSAHADCSGVLCSNVKISRLFMTDNDFASIGTTGTETNLTCTPPGNAYIRLYMGGSTPHPRADQIYALLLTAHETQRPISIGVSSASDCTLSYVISNI